MKKETNIERITCKCGEVIAGCVHGQQDASWDKDRRGYMEAGYVVDIIAVESFKFGKCMCEGSGSKKRFKVLAEPAPTLFTT